MMYPYMILADETEITHSHVIEGNGFQVVEVHFEHPTAEGFDAARCTLPTYTWIKREGFTDKEIEKFERFLRSNAHLIVRNGKTECRNGQGGFKPVLQAPIKLSKRKKSPISLL